MNINLNNKKYYAMGGIYDEPNNDEQPIYKKYLRRPSNERIYTDRHNNEHTQKNKSTNSGHAFFAHADDIVTDDSGKVIYDPKIRGSRKQEIIRGHREALSYLRYLENKYPGLMEENGINIDDAEKELNRFDKSKHSEEPNWKEPTIKKVNEGLNNTNWNNITGLLKSQNVGLFIENDKDYNGNGPIKSGKNSFSSYGQFHFDTDKEGNPIIKEDRYNLNFYQRQKLKEALGNEWENYSKHGNMSSFVDDYGNRHIMFENSWKPNGNGFTPTRSGIIVLDRKGNVVPIIASNTFDYDTKDNDGNAIKRHPYQTYRLANDGEQGVNYINDFMQKDKKGNTYLPYFVNNEALPYREDTKKIFYDWEPRDYNMVNGEYAYGGRTTRLYAVGGLTGEQIPIGEQPEDYNMVGAGGSHEQNPMGGVPYGVNQDGSQNMVEEGEVSVGNNVFSDRTAISPELCQQLGLPEGTSPAQAMQQIEALYEQGQIGDEEFQEIQQIIFEDQEAQKQNVGQSYQQGEVGGEGVPQEGITPEMMGQMPQQMPPQQGGIPQQPEGITPEMMQGYAYGGRMNYWR